MIFPRSEVGVQADARGFFSKRRKALTPALRWAGAGLPDALHCAARALLFCPRELRAPSRFTPLPPQVDAQDVLRSTCRCEVRARPASANFPPPDCMCCMTPRAAWRAPLARASSDAQNPSFTRATRPEARAHPSLLPSPG